MRAAAATRPCARAAARRCLPCSLLTLTSRTLLRLGAAPARSPERIRPIAERFGLDADAVLDNIVYARAYTYEQQFGGCLVGWARSCRWAPRCLGTVRALEGAPLGQLCGCRAALYGVGAALPSDAVPADHAVARLPPALRAASPACRLPGATGGQDGEHRGAGGACSCCVGSLARVPSTTSSALRLAARRRRSPSSC